MVTKKREKKLSNDVENNTLIATVDGKIQNPSSTNDILGTGDTGPEAGRSKTAC